MRIGRPFLLWPNLWIAASAGFVAQTLVQLSRFGSAEAVVGGPDLGFTLCGCFRPLPEPVIPGMG
jgi:hypothetical protein